MLYRILYANKRTRGYYIHLWWWPRYDNRQYNLKTVSTCALARSHTLQHPPVQYTQTHVVGILTFRLDEWHVMTKKRYMLLFIRNKKQKKPKTENKTQRRMNEGKITEANWTMYTRIYFDINVDRKQKIPAHVI